MASNEGEAPAPVAGAPQAADGGSQDMDAMGSSMGLSAAGSAQDVRWTAPEGWVARPASSMRVGSFLIRGANGQQADLSIVPLAGDAGGDLANINRWRGQLNLSPISPSELPQMTQTIHPDGRKMLFVEFSSQERMINNQYKRGLMAAIYKQGGRTWFFKMLGEDKTVRSAKPAFLQFLKSLHFAQPS